jgi:phosphoglycerate dehydrogenase-like enzyme
MIQVHFETKHDKPPVFRITRELIEAAASRSKVGKQVRPTLGSDLANLDPLGTAVGLVTSNDVIRDPRFPLAELGTRAPALRWIHIIGAGIEPLLPLNWLPSRVSLTNNSGVHVQKTGEFATMALLMLNARVPEIYANQMLGRWSQIFTPSIAGRTLAVIGLGDMGGAAARQGKHLGMRVLGLRRQARPHRFVDEVFEPGRLHTMLGQADFTFVAAPLTPDTRNLIDRQALASAKRGAGLINVGRAGVVDYDALREALASGALSGAVLDVFDPEPLPADSPLWKTPNLYISPHCSSDDSEAYLPLTLDLVFENAARLIAGRRVKNRVDPKRGY